ncbi:MAG: 4'-phosphopantetheinyl transferase superfamily protein [Flavobacterium sp.]|nr:4'-phosphopantetheinyl transferase superfamily protein [Flavobacterium sp.]
MSLYLHVHPNSHTQLLVWSIDESIAELHGNLVLTEQSQRRIQSMKSVLHQRAFLSVRQLLLRLGYTDADLYYDASGKPHLTDGKFISISHSHQLAVVIVSNQSVGVDVELVREKVAKIGSKFCATELHYLAPDLTTEIQRLTVIWGAKEAVFKIVNQEGISFKDHIFVAPFKLNSAHTSATLALGLLPRNFAVQYQLLADYALVYTFETT